MLLRLDCLGMRFDSGPFNWWVRDSEVRTTVPAKCWCWCWCWFSRASVRLRVPMNQIQWPHTWDDSRRQRHWASTSKWTEAEKCCKTAAVKKGPFAKSPSMSKFSRRCHRARQTHGVLRRKANTIVVLHGNCCKHFKCCRVQKL